MSFHLDHICLRSENVDALIDFYRNVMGMDSQSLGSMVLCDAPERRLLLKEGAKGLNFGAFSVNSHSELNAIKDRIAATGVALEQSVSPLFADTGAFSFRDPDGNVMVFGSGSEDRAAADTHLKGRLQHVVVASPDIERLLKFYTEVVGFELSDRVQDEDGSLTACFLRGDNEHHCFAIFAAGESRLDHHCYEVGEWSLIRDWADHAAEQDVLIQWGPGRHGPGNNVFFMIHDPDGNWLEISAELEIVPPGKEVGVWAHSERTLNKWGRGLLRN